MAHLFQRNVVLGVSGGIAAYKSAELVRALQTLGANVRVVMTRGACEFITPLTLQALSGNPVHLELLDEQAEQAMGHIELARWADLLLIAPATADLLARLAAGRGDDLLTTLALACRAPLLLAPAMNQAMWRAPATADNVALLLARGAVLIGPAEGIQACGDTGPGRMEEPAAIAAAAATALTSGRLADARVVITAGPTREALDPVRYLSNRSSGRMGFALARAAADAGARVTLISGPVDLPTPPAVARVDVESALDMLGATEAAVRGGCELLIACAAVADYRPGSRSSQKIKKGDETLSLELVRNPDILATIAAGGQVHFAVGFAAETDRVEEYARAKLRAKGIDLIVANDVSQADIGFNSEQNAVTAIWQDGSVHYPIRSKQQIATALIELIADRMQCKPAAEPPRTGHIEKARHGIP
jgi:phosphopantothenoylcysteine decarboxylase / phosphopantothenate---cysteine ligase